jgi:hypothetical protein
MGIHRILLMLVTIIEIEIEFYRTRAKQKNFLLLPCGRSQAVNFMVNSISPGAASGTAA